MTVDAALAAALAEDLNAMGYTAGALRNAWSAIGDDALGQGLRDPALRGLGPRTDALAVAARLLALGTAQPVADVDRAFPAVGVAGLVALGLANRDGDRIRPAAMVRPQAFADDTGAGQWWIASDLDESALGGPLPTDHVLGAGGASLTLAGLQLPTVAARGLDVGAGCGIQSLRARRDVGAMVATDVSERALWFTELNALLNGVTHVETRLGSLFEPVAGERFDRIVSNPPFVITPRVAGVPVYEYRDAGFEGDELVASFIRGVGEFLAPGGVAQLLGNWETRDGMAGLDRVRQWVESSSIALDAWVVEREELDPLAYAQLWVRDGGTAPGRDDYARLVDAWLEDFSARGVSAVGFGYVVLQRPVDGEPTLSRYERVPQPVGPALGAHLAAALSAHARLSALDDVALAASVFVVASDVTEARHHLPGSADPTVLELRQGGGFGRVLNVDSALAAVVGACDGDLALGPLTDAVAELLEVDAAAVRADVFPRVRELVFTGFLRFADDGAPS